jgi:hypothetical protein
MWMTKRGASGETGLFTWAVFILMVEIVHRLAHTQLSWKGKKNEKYVSYPNGFHNGLDNRCSKFKPFCRFGRCSESIQGEWQNCPTP